MKTKIHYACGKRYLADYTNIDAVHNPAAPRPPDILHAMQFDRDGTLLERVPLGDGCADEVLSVHFLEHVYQWEAPAVIAEWRRLLCPGGLLVIEMPDLLKCARNLMELHKSGGKPLQQLAMWGIFGDDTLRDPLMCHKSGWWPEALIDFLSSNGFTSARTGTPQWHKAGRDLRDMRITAFKC